MTYTENPTEADFPLIDRCIICDAITSWQPRYEVALRPPEHKALLQLTRPDDFVPESRTVKICADCTPDKNSALRMLIRKHYPTYAKRKGI